MYALGNNQKRIVHFVEYSIGYKPISTINQLIKENRQSTVYNYIQTVKQP